MFSKYGIFCKIIETGSFTRAAEQLGYTQSAVSQTVKSLEQELGAVLIERKRDGLALTADGRQYFPYIQAIHSAEKALHVKKAEMLGLENSVIQIGTFTGVSRTLLPPLMKEFQQRYPSVTFVLRQGEYTSIEQWIQSGAVDFGFLNTDAAETVDTHTLYEEEMLAVLPNGHPLATQAELSLKDLAAEPVIQLDEGDYSVTLTAFAALGIEPQIKYKISDDYTILAMVRQGLGITFLYKNVLDGFDHGAQVRKLKEAPKRTIALAWKNKTAMPYAAQRFAEFISKHF